ncbi:MAG TPA: hypothetical protein VH592_22175 [Gemmataceae bacterium]|jgi:hypothetical protein
MDPLCIFKPVLRVSGCLSLVVVIVLTGCGKGARSIESAEVSGKVLFQGKPLPGGRITFASANTAFAASELIEENGTYTIKAPVGDVKISVDNSMLQQQGGKMGGGKPKSFPRPPGKEEETRPVKGKYVKIPSKFKDATTSGLTYTVKKGAQTHDIELSADPG